MRTPILAAAAALALSALPSAASAATATFGSDLSLAPDSPALECNDFLPGATTCTAVLTGVHAGNAHPAAAPMDGVIVKLRFKVGGAQSGTLRIVRTVAGGRTGAGTGPSLSVPAAGTYEAAVQLPVKQGDFLAADAAATTGYSCSGGSVEVYSPPLADGGPGRSASAAGPCELLLNADIESDADGDGAGDDTQDADDDGDGVPDAGDACPLVAAATADGCPDTAAPGFTLGGKTTQKVGSSIVIPITATTEDLLASVSGAVSVPGASKAYRLRAVKNRAVARGTTARVKLKLKKKLRSAIKKALGAGRKAKAKVTVQVRDAAGNAATKKRTIKLKRG
jgi:hypothetical protein